MKCEFDIIAKVLRFNPELNTRLSYAGNFFELLSSPFVTILLNVFVLFLFFSGYMLYQAKRAHISFWVKIIMICGISGCLCSLIDKLFWGGSLDFLQIPTLFIFDLKDCYLTVAEVIFVAMSEIARQFEMGKNPTSKTNLLKTLQMVVTAMVGDGYKATSHDVNFLLSVYSKKNRKALTVSCANHRNFRGYVMEVCHRIVTGKSYELEYKTKRENG